MRHKILILLVLGLLPLLSHAQYYPQPEYKVTGTPPSQETEKAVDKLLNDFKIAWANEDAKTIAELHADDAEWINAFGRIFRGSAEIGQFLENRLFPSFAAEVSKNEIASFKEISRRYIGDNAAIINSQMDSERGSSVESGTRRVAINFVVEKIDGQWKIVHQVITDIRQRRTDG